MKNRFKFIILTLVILSIVAFCWFPNKYYRYIRRQALTYITTPRGVIPEVKFQKIALGDDVKGRFSSLTLGPDNKLYAATIDGKIKTFILRENGELTLERTYRPFGELKTLLIGIDFDPFSTGDSLVAWISYSVSNPGWFEFSRTDLKNGVSEEFEGRLARLQLDAKTDSVLKKEVVVINLPRFGPNKENLVNSIEFGPDKKLYVSQGASTGMGWCDCEEGQNPSRESLLSGAVLCLDLSLLPEQLPLDVKPKDGGGQYNPYEKDAPLQIYATGLRNAYDLVWHSNGELYATINGSGGKENTPSSDPASPYYSKPDASITYTGPKVPAVQEVQPDQDDFMARVQPGGYYGHPNPLRAEYVLNRGDKDVDNTEYNGVQPDKNFRGFTYDFGPHIAPTGITEYTSNAFHGSLKGLLLICRLGRKDIVITKPGGEKKDIIEDYDGKAMGLQLEGSPIDLVVNPNTGDIYVSTFFNEESITLFHPIENPKDSLIIDRSITSSKKENKPRSGAELYSQNCQLCHGANGLGGIGPSLIGINKSMGHEQILEQVRNGSANKAMPAWKDNLSVGDIDRVITYITGLHEEQIP